MENEILQSSILPYLIPCSNHAFWNLQNGICLKIDVEFERKWNIVLVNQEDFHLPGLSMVHPQDDILLPLFAL